MTIPATAERTRLSESVSPSFTEPAALVPSEPERPRTQVLPALATPAAPIFSSAGSHSEDITQIVGALAKAQGEFQTVERKLTAQVTSRKEGARSYSYDYADLASVLQAVRPALSAHGIAIVQLPSAAKKDFVTVTTILAHESGQWFKNDLAVGCFSGDPQAIGSAITYARRYALTAMLGVAPEHDDDGAGATSYNGNGSSVRSGQGPVQMPQREQPPTPRPAAPVAPLTSARTVPPPAPGPQTSAGFTIKACERRKRATGNGEFVLVQFSTGQVASSTRPEMMAGLERAFRAKTVFSDVVLTKQGNFTYVEELIPMGGAS